MSEKTVGLFGTCGKSHWRDSVIEAFDKEGVTYFNPQVQNWTPACAENEANHMANDEILAFVVTSETAGVASLAEIGIAVANVLTSRYPRYLVVYVEPTFESTDPVDAQRVKDSNGARTLVIHHLHKGVASDRKWLDRVFVCDSIQHLTNVCIGLTIKG